MAQRQILFQSITNLTNLNITNWEMILYGNAELDFAENVKLFEAVHTYIENTDRL